MARFSSENRAILVALFVVIAIVTGGIAAASLDVNPDRDPTITLDAGTAALQADLQRQFPGIEQTFLAVVDSRDPETARAQALALAASLNTAGGPFLSAFVPGTGPFYDNYELLFRTLDEVRLRVDLLLQMQPLYQALAAAPDIFGLAALVDEIGNAVEQGRSPPGLDSVLLAASAATEGEVKGKPRPIQWTALAGLGGEARSQRWFVLATPQPDREREAVRLAAKASDGMQGVSWLWPRRAFGTAPSLVRDFLVPAGLSAFVTLTLLGAGLGSFRQSIAVLLCGGVAVSVAAGAAAALGRPLDAATWSFALAALAPVIVCGSLICIGYASAGAARLTAQQAVMLAAHRSGGLVSAIVLLFAAVWVAWLVRQLPSLSQFAVVALAGTAAAWLVVLTLLPACLVLFGRGRDDASRHWFDDVLGGSRSLHLRNLLDIAAMLVLAIAVFGAAFLPGVRFGERQLPSTPGALLATPDARGAVHILAPPDQVPDVIRVLSSLPEVGAIRTAAQFLPPDAPVKIAQLRRLAALSSFEPAPRAAADEDRMRESFAELDRRLALIAASPTASTGLRDAALRLRRAMALFSSPQPPTAARIEALEASLFGGLGKLSAAAARLPQLPEPGVADLDPRLARRFIAADGRWRIEVMPREGTGRLSFAAAMRRAVPQAAGEPMVALARNEIIHHETLLAVATALVAAAVLVLGALRTLTGSLVTLLPLACFVTLTAAVSAVFDVSLNAAMLAGASAVLAVLAASAMAVAGISAGEGEAGHRRSAAFRSGLLPPLALAGAVAPLALSSQPAVAELGAAMTMLLFIAAVLAALVVPALARWLRALDGRHRADEPYARRDKR